MTKTPSPNLARAQKLSERLVTQVNGLIGLHESNRIVVYSDRIAGQIPKSYAAHTFNLMSSATHYYEVVRVCALWDKSKPDRESIPSFGTMLSDPSLLAEIHERIDEDWSSPPAEAPELYVGRAAQAKRELARTLSVAKRVEGSKFVRNLRDFRDKYIAHSLSDEADLANGKTRTPPKYGDERHLLSASIAIVRRFRLAVTGTDYMFDAMIEQSRRNAEQFWTNCSITIPVR